jgi:6-phosphogluconolactonase (cycloisomerase 2 family)
VSLIVAELERSSMEANNMTRIHKRIVRTFSIALPPLLMLLVLGAVPASAEGSTGAVYTLSNDAGGNAVVVFHRAAVGTLTPAGSVATGGQGSGTGLGSQGSLVLSDDGRRLLAVNAGSDELSAFAVSGDGVTLTDVVRTGGDLPISATIHGNLIYVLNDGSNELTGLRISGRGELTRLRRSAIGLSTVGVEPAQVEFTPNGRQVVVTEKNTNLIDLFRVHAGGGLSGPRVVASEGATPFGFAFDPQGRLVVSEAFGGAPDASAMSSYRVGHKTLTAISASVPTGQTAACWVVVTPNGRFAYTTNTGSASVSGYDIASDGALSLFASVAGTTNAGPTDMGLAGADFLYTLDSGAAAISAFAVASDGSLAPMAGAAGLPASAVGLAVS